MQCTGHDRANGDTCRDATSRIVGYSGSDRSRSPLLDRLRIPTDNVR